MRLEQMEGSLQLASYHGGVALVGVALLEAQRQFAPNIPLPKRSLHITLVTAAEYKGIGRPSLAQLSVVIPLTHVYALGETSSSQSAGAVKWIVVVWNHANIW